MTTGIARSLRLLPLALVLAACADRSPLAGGADPLAFAPSPSVALTCRVSVAAGTVHCAAPTPATGGARGDLVVGGQNQFVRLVSSGVSYDSTAAILRADVTVQNLMPQPLGTHDGSTPAAEGVLVFFHSGPIVTSGTGSVSVANEDGVATFTAGSQPYFRYDGILHTEQTSAAKEWRFSVPATVGLFEFTVLVSAPHPAGSGYVTVTPQHPSIRAGATRQLAGVVRSGAGMPQGGPVQWSSSDTSVAVVSATGLVTGVGAGTATITATSGGRAGSTAVTVGSGEGDDIPPTLAGLAFPDDSVDVTARADSAVVELTIDDDGSPISLIAVTMRSPGRSTLAFTTGCERTSGTETAGTWRCWVHFPRGGEPGAWTVEQVTVGEASGHVRAYTAEELRAAGWPYTVQVSSSGADTEGPVLTGFSIDPDSVDVSGAADTVRLTVSGNDATGITQVSVFFRSPGGELLNGTSSCALQSGTETDGTWECGLHVARNTEAGIWQVENIQLMDGLGHSTNTGGAAVDAAGHERALRVTSTPSDSSAPLLTGFSFAPDTAHVSAGPDTVVVTVRATDDVVGIEYMDVIARSASGSTTLIAGCELVEGTRNDGTFRCNLAIQQGAERGAYTFDRLRLQDGINRFRDYDAAALQSAGYPTTVIVQD